jgi:lipopolysaccharide transport system ATP-binding protein
MNPNLAISVTNLSKKYLIGKKKDGSLRGTITNTIAGNKNNNEVFWALNNVNFEIKKGDVVGIIGKNGAGKSTLLKILSQITSPTSGRIEINGRIASLLEVGTGFHPELTGRENIFLNGTILGMTRKEVRAKFDEIVDFSGVEKFIDTAVKHYSSGMYVRLAFAVAAHLEPEILIIDEVLAVGDADFQKKCLGKMQDVANQGRTVLFVSHNMASVRSLCNKGILLSQGEILFSGAAQDTLDLYTKHDSNRQTIIDTSNYKSRFRGVNHIGIKTIELNSSDFVPEDPFEIEIHLAQLDIEIEIKEIDLAIFIFDNLQNVVYQLSTLFLDEKIYFDENKSFSFKLKQLKLSSGSYSIGVWLSGNGFEQDYVDANIEFDVQHGSIYSNKNPNIVSIVQADFEFIENNYS